MIPYFILVIARANQKVAGKNSKSLKFVDKRLKKDKRSLKRAERRNKGSKQEKMKKINQKPAIAKTIKLYFTAKQKQCGYQ